MTGRGERIASGKRGRRAKLRRTKQKRSTGERTRRKGVTLKTKSRVHKVEKTREKVRLEGFKGVTGKDKGLVGEGEGRKG